MHLPTKKDWELWYRLEEEYTGLIHDHPVINFLPILIIIEEGMANDHPYSRQEIQEILYRRKLAGKRNWWQHLLPPTPIAEQTGKNKRTSNLSKSTEHQEVKISNSSDHILYKDMQDREIIYSTSFKEHIEDLKKNSASLAEHQRLGRAIKRMEQLHGRERIYYLTPKGKVFLNIIISKPWYVISLNRYAAKRGYSAISILSWLYLQNLSVSQNNENINLDDILNKNEISSFDKMQSPFTRLIMEFKDLKRIENKFKTLLKMNKYRPNLNSRNNEEEFICEEFINLANFYLSIVESKLKMYNLSNEEVLNQVKILEEIEDIDSNE